MILISHKYHVNYNDQGIHVLERIPFILLDNLRGILTVVISEAEDVFLAVLVSVGRRRVSHPRGDAEGAQQRVRQDRLRDHGGCGLAVELEHLLAVTTWTQMMIN